MRGISWLGLTCLVLASTASAACSAEASGDGGTSESDVLGVTDLGLMEKTFGLETDVRVNGQFTRDVTRGACHKAYASDPTVQFRRYKTGAAFFHAKNQDDPTAQDERPVVCVDLDSANMALDGVALDAVFRFGLGKAIGSDGAPFGETMLHFEGGQLHLSRTGSQPGPTEAEVLAMRNEHGAKLVADPIFLGGRLLDVTIKDADVLSVIGGGETVTTDLTISGSLAAFAYAAAWKKTGTAFSLSRDPLGSLAHLRAQGDAKNLKVQAEGDGPGWLVSLYFPVATITEVGFSDGFFEEAGTITNKLRLTGPSNPGDPFVDDPGSASCERVTKFAPGDQVGVPQPIACQGL